MKWAVESGIKPLPGGGSIFLAVGVTTADDDHELVVRHPQWWSDTPPEGHLRGPGWVDAKRPSGGPPAARPPKPPRPPKPKPPKPPTKRGNHGSADLRR